MITKLIGARAKELRERAWISQMAFADKIGMARSYYAEVETGKRNLAARNLLKIAKGHDLTLAEFFDSPIFDPLYVDIVASDDESRMDYASVEVE